LRGVDLEVEEGELVGLLGPNGAGKSTLVKIAAGLVRPTNGRAAIGGARAGSADALARLGYLAELFRFPGWYTADEVLALHQRLAGSGGGERERAELLELVSLSDARQRRVDGMSKGMQQRLGLAQALVGDPRLLLLDEPTNGLDPAGRDEMLMLIRRTGTEFGIAVIVASHLLGEIERVCDHLVAIEDGKLLRSAPLGSFTERTGTLSVEVEEGQQVLAERLVGRGLRAIVDGSAVLIDLTDERPFDIVRDTVADLGLPLIRIEQRRHRLEDLFRDAPAGSVPLGASTERPPAMPPR